MSDPQDEFKELTRALGEAMRAAGEGFRAAFLSVAPGATPTPAEGEVAEHRDATASNGAWAITREKLEKRNSEILRLRSQIKDLVWDQQELRFRIKKLQDANARLTESGVGVSARIAIRNCVGAMSGESTPAAVVRHVSELRGTIQERDRVIQNLQAEAEVRNCSEPYRQTNVELQQRVGRAEADRTQLQKELSGAWEMNRNLTSELDARSRLIDLLNKALGDIGTVVTDVVDKLPLNADESGD